MGTHAYMSPSMFKTVKHCPASALRQFQVNQLDDLIYQAAPVFYGLSVEDMERWELICNDPQSLKYSEDGTKLHTVMEECLDEGVHLVEDVTHKVKLAETSQKLHEDAFIMSRLSECIAEQLEHLESAEQVGIEFKVNVAGLPQFGTIDLMWVYNRTLYVRDLKTGRVDVESEQNDQLMNYAVGILDSYGWDNIDNVKFKILGLHFTAEEWECDIDTIRTYRDEVMFPAFLKAYQINPEVKTGDHCLYCTGKRICQEWQEEFTESMVAVEDATVSQLSTDEQVSLFKLCKQAYNLEKDLKKELLIAFEGFEEPQGVTRVAGRKTEAWTDDAEEKLKAHKKVIYEQKMKKPKEVKALLGDDMLEDLTKTVVGSPYIKL